MDFFHLACLLAFAAAAASADLGTPDLNTMSKFVKVKKAGDSVIYSTPAMFYFDVESGDMAIMRCLVDDPDNCEVFQKGYDASFIYVYMEYVYLARPDGIWRCESFRKDSCESVYKSSPVLSLSMGDGHMYAGLQNGALLICNGQKPYSCRTLHSFLVRMIWSLKVVDTFIYVGLDDGELMKCSLTEENNCSKMYDMGTYITGLENVGSTILSTVWNGHLWNCSKKKTNAASYDCVSVAINIPYPRAISFFNGSIYVVKAVRGDGIYICNTPKDRNCVIYSRHKTLGIAFTYGTYNMQSYYEKEDTSCSWQPDLVCPPYITYYDIHQRASLVVHVKDGKLYDARGVLVDTRDADEGDGQPGPAAIFVMGPDGRILLTKSYQRESLFSSSLFAGHPLSGAGEMIVENGVIKKIFACSEHYQADLPLNKQVVDSLRSQGYTDPIITEICSDENDQLSNRVY